YSARPAKEICATSPHFLQDLGLDKHLSPTRSNGLHAMLEKIYLIAKSETA
ncbi:MAG: SufE family protein, partial [Halomonadaceae bacterium]|nr:SufE family protein [Halomonadaceae bacterium]